jgi:hypothetical protein
MPGGYGKRIAAIRETRETFGVKWPVVIEFMRVLDAAIASRQIAEPRTDES